MAQHAKDPAGGLTPVMHVKGDTLLAGNYEHFYVVSTDADAGKLFATRIMYGLNWEKDRIGFKVTGLGYRYAVRLINSYFQKLHNSKNFKLTLL